ncbi:hypothetical protein ABZ329_29625 [Streptomyces rubiginosohelvolus]|uniref:hypothetical protein n=1 Tax=Streptomyces rubiginosohelvolus TaxID=67362 RepID=UPI00340652C1
MYVLLLASLESEERGLQQVAGLAGLDSAEALRPYIAELEAVGAADMKHHIGQGEIVAVNEVPTLPEQRQHACVPCSDCGKCSCEYIKGVCQDCAAIRSVRERSREDIARWKAQLDEGKTYAMGSSTSRLHRWDCRSLMTVEKRVEAMEAGVESVRRGNGRAYLAWPGLPSLFTAQELRAKKIRRKRCELCGPDPL